MMMPSARRVSKKSFIPSFVRQGVKIGWTNAELAGMPRSWQSLTALIRSSSGAAYGSMMSLKGASMGLSRELPLDLIVYVDPVAYYNLPYSEKDGVAKAVGRTNWKYRGSGKHMMIVPGRIGTSSPELGVPTTFADISEFEVICEVAESGAGYNPELSYGSHIFQDLVEAQILYTAVFESGQTRAYHPECLIQLPNLLTELFPELEKLDPVIRIVDVSGTGSTVYHDLRHEELVVTV